MRKMPYRLLCTATAAPNDYIELGTSSEALGELGHMDMLGRFFKNDGTARRIPRAATDGFHAPRAWQQQQWRFKGHAEEAVLAVGRSWARACADRPTWASTMRVRPPPLEHREHIVEARTPPEGTLFDLPAIGLREEREEARRTIDGAVRDRRPALVDARRARRRLVPPERRGRPARER